MPPKVLPQPEDFALLAGEILALGFRPIHDVEFRTDFRRLKLQAPRSREGRETGFVFTANELTVKVWTTWLARENQARETDEAWVLIVRGDNLLYATRPIHRTKGFLKNLLVQARLARERVLRRPLCPKCAKFMDITKGPGMKSRYWRCNRLGVHADKMPSYLDWDEPLLSEDLVLARALRRKRQSYAEKRKKAGKPLHVALLKRKGWRRAS